MSSSPVSATVINDLVFVCIDNPPVNATSTSVREGLLEVAKEFGNSDYRAVIVHCTGKTFVAGGDISEFGKPPLPPNLPDVCNAIEQSTTPWIATMHGSVLGGGFELALSCAYRIANEKTVFGLPEVNIGLVPGSGGSQRLPRLIGIKESISISSGGQTISAEKLFDLGGLHQTFAGDPKEAATRFAEDLPERPVPLGKLPNPDDDSGDLDNERARLQAKSRGEMAALHNIDALEWACKLPFEEGMARERALHMQLRNSPESRALRHVFFSSRNVSKIEAIKGVSPRELNHISIVGGGLMGAGVAFACLQAGMQVSLVERDDEAATAGQDRIHGLIDGGEKRGKLTPEQGDTCRKSLAATIEFAEVANTDLAIEAVFEDLAVKQEVFKKLADVVSPETILATNTSYLNPAAIMDGLPNPGRMIGLHFFSPAHIMKLLEIVRLPDTSPEVLATAFAFGKRLRKTGVLSGICDGFIGNRMLAAYRRQADYMLIDGALPHEVDAAMREFGMPMGPYEVQDMAGLQISWANRKRQATTRDPEERYVNIGDTLCEMERFGQRSGKGWYIYQDGSRKGSVDPEVASIIEQASRESGIERRPFEASEIRERLLAAMINEGALIVDEGIAERDLDVDMVKIHGYGFPKWRGGPMHYASEIGWDNIKRSFDEVMQQSPNSWRISKRLMS
ncbi:MAG: FAD-dependent oxidoreductase [Pseudomonadota bacterium]